MHIYHEVYDRFSSIGISCLFWRMRSTWSCTFLVIKIISFLLSKVVFFPIPPSLHIFMNLVIVEDIIISEGYKHSWL